MNLLPPSIFANLLFLVTLILSILAYVAFSLFREELLGENMISKRLREPWKTRKCWQHHVSSIPKQAEDITVSYRRKKMLSL